MRGSLCWPTLRPNNWSKRANEDGKSSYTRTNCGGRAKSRLAVSTAQVLRALQKQLEEYRRAIEKLFAQHPDHDLFGSLPGAGAKLAPRLLSEIGSDREQYPDAQGLQCVAGTAR